MSYNPQSRESSEATSWALYWELDRRDDRQGFRVALSFAILIHAALLLVRLADEPVVLPPIDAVIRPQLNNVAIKEPERPPTPRPVERTAVPEAVRVPVPAELAPPEPLPLRDAPVLPVELPPSPVFIEAIPVPPPVFADAPVRFTGEMERPVRIAGIDPAYTEVARKIREQGVVILDAVIQKSGEVTEIKVIKELGFGLTEAAVRAVETWRFDPARLDGRPVSVRYTLTVRFSLR